MTRWHYLVCILICNILVSISICYGAMFRESSPLFQDSFHVEKITNDNYKQLVLNQTNQVWLVDFYSPYCPHCRIFAPELELIAKAYAKSPIVHVGAVDCTSQVAFCNRETIRAYPQLMLFHVPPTAKDGIVLLQGEHKNKKSVMLAVEDALGKEKMYSGVNLHEELENLPKSNTNNTAMEGSTQYRYSETSLPMKYYRLREAGSTALHTLEQDLFMGTETLADERYDAAVDWIDSLGAAFPLETNRLAFRELAKTIRTKRIWDRVSWDEVIREWKVKVQDITFPSNLLVSNDTETWVHCETFTCGLWTLLHSLSANLPMLAEQSARSSQLMKPSQLALAIRGFVKYFFGCEECVHHFLLANPDSRIQKFAESDTTGSHEIIYWLWEMHSIVNTVTGKPVWPSITECSSCYRHRGELKRVTRNTIRKDEMTAYLSSVFIQDYKHAWRMLYEAEGLRSAMSYSMSGSTMPMLLLFVLVVGFILIIFRPRHTKHKYGKTWQSLKFKQKHEHDG